MRSPSAERERNSQRGSVTAEFAVALPAVAVVLAVCLAAVMLVAQQVRLTDAAADAARALGRGESVAAASSIAHRIGEPSSLTTSHDGEFVCVGLSRSGRGLLATIELTAHSCALTDGR